ncbi:ribosome biogenesis/translation initiation ATPase RLI [Candidatus Woesearchaeota archaeon]|nr:ribosome biogenesis/translation initiation ATPase RLI [Candidatus Woesearchaeota archaeon]
MARIAVVEKDRCFPVKCGDFLCRKLCPVNRTGTDCITQGEDGKARIDEALCTGCGICPKRCPFGAIHIINLPEELGSAPIHQYGENGFHLYNLPIPIFGKVVGILGRNGIGKSTAIKILAGTLKPNLGNLWGEPSHEELIERFKGSEMQRFFEEVKAGGIRIGYKPQNIDQIPKAFSGRVRDLLTKADERGMLDEIVPLLQLEKILDRDITHISGGELQRVAIAATVLKRANLLVFDEPSSHLDIKQRIRVARFIRSLADEETAVLVVEHDLIILDYMTDLVHLMYGAENAYGIVSGPKATKAGINTYLSGYLKEENVRFRDSAIAFSTRPSESARRTETLLAWKGLKKTLGDFELTAEGGEAQREQVLGILGENGIGKTTFARILAGEIQPDAGELSDTGKVSYKPQYLEAGDAPAAMILADAVAKHQTTVVRPLGLDRLMDKTLAELSGGQLQRVAIARCLAQQADLYLLDEPSAYLDVEQRLIVSKVLRDFAEQAGKTVLVIDHDLLFIDYLSEKLIVFDGEPARRGAVTGPFTMGEGMNRFLGDLDITMRRDQESHRPRINKEGSVMDRRQKEAGKRYYT